MTEAQKTVDKTIPLGTVGKIELDFDKGIASVALTAEVPGQAGISGSVLVKCDSQQLIDAIFTAIEAKLPPSAKPIEEAVKAIIKQAVLAIP